MASHRDARPLARTSREVLARAMRRDATSSPASSSRDDRASTSIDRRSARSLSSDASRVRIARRFARARRGRRTRDARDVFLVFSSHRARRRRRARAKATRCGACARRTRRCERFAKCRAMARGGDGWDDGRCLSCAGIVPMPWERCDPGEVERRLAPRGWCSWCGASSRHRDARVGTAGDVSEPLFVVRAGDAQV